ncbi:hypothetical protein E2C01_100881 [Portunus trituberculatus]|uniref:Uncharacterized protein n=1 Tax=Portunus trituberculatus TaxID=210409 RepID=A0A5B7KDC0_PORTR|nr:hypothetical protein [Portunus trituberculatus]
MNHALSTSPPSLTSTFTTITFTSITTTTTNHHRTHHAAPATHQRLEASLTRDISEELSPSEQQKDAEIYVPCKHKVQIIPDTYLPSPPAPGLRLTAAGLEGRTGGFDRGRNSLPGPSSAPQARLMGECKEKMCKKEE